VDTDFHAIGQAPVAKAPIRIGREAMVQGRASVLKGVTVGEGAVVRWGAVVAGDVAPKTMVLGNPAVEVGTV
jgi:maltose O-acetyltransferase